MTKHIANILSGCRILGSILLLFFPVFSTAFFILYLLCGFSEMIDGTIARKTNSASEMGGKIDTIADFVFMAVSVVKLLPSIFIPGWLWIWVTAIALVKTANILLRYILNNEFVALHTIMNKATGLLLFLLPFTISFVDPQYSLLLVCAVATFSSIQEGIFIIAGRGHK